MGSFVNLDSKDEHVYTGTLKTTQSYNHLLCECSIG